MFNIGKMKQAAQRMQADLARMHQELEEARLDAAVGGGAVTIVANGHGEIQSLTIAPEAVDPGDLGMLQDLIVAAVNEAQRKARAMADERMKRITGGLQIPGLSP